jgi:hypothetical protein
MRGVKFVGAFENAVAGELLRVMMNQRDASFKSLSRGRL